MLPNARLRQATIAAIAGEVETHSYYYQDHLIGRETTQQVHLAWHILFRQPLAAVATSDRGSIQLRLYP